MWNAPSYESRAREMQNLAAANSRMRRRRRNRELSFAGLGPEQHHMIVVSVHVYDLLRKFISSRRYL